MKDGPTGLLAATRARSSVTATGRCELRPTPIRRGARGEHCDGPVAASPPPRRGRSLSGRWNRQGYDARMVSASGVSRVLLAFPRGYCAGVERAVETVELALEHYGPPVYVRKQIVHNIHVVRDLEARGAIFVESEAEAPPGATIVFSAHGVAPAVHTSVGRAIAQRHRRNLPARHEGARTGSAVRRRRLHRRADRPRRP